MVIIVPSREGNMGVAKSLHRLQESFYWADMCKDVQHFISQCSTCQQVKYETKKPSGLLQPLSIPKQPFGKTFPWILSPAYHHPRAILLLLLWWIVFLRVLTLAHFLQNMGLSRWLLLLWTWFANTMASLVA